MRIVHLTQSTVAEITGGLEYHIAYLTDALRRRGHEVIVLNTASGRSRSWQGPRAEARRDSYVPVRGRAAWREMLVMFWERMRKGRSVAAVMNEIDRLRPDIVHQHSYIGGLRICRLVERKYPVVFTNHTGAYIYMERMAITRWIQRQFMKRFTMVIGPSRELLPATENSRYIPNGVDVGKFHPVPDERRIALKRKHGCADKRVFVCPRRWAPTKGILELAHALRRLKSSVRDSCVFLFVGNETPGYEAYQENVRRVLGTVAADVRVLGNRNHEELSEMMSMAHACIIPSIMEATSLACLESMACGTPVIGTAAEGLLELIHHQENGWLVPVRDEKALAECIETVAETPHPLLLRMREAARKSVRERYTWSRAAGSTEDVYQTALRKWADCGVVGMAAAVA